MGQEQNAFSKPVKIDSLLQSLNKIAILCVQYKIAILCVQYFTDNQWKDLELLSPEEYHSQT